MTLRYSRLKKYQSRKIGPPGEVNASLEEDLRAINQEVPLQNQRLAEVMEDYPFDFYLGESGMNEEDIAKKGYQYILYHLHTTGYNIKTMLGYPVDETETDYITVQYRDFTPNLVRIPVSPTGFTSFYVKHILTGNVFLGSKWDADTTWDQALVNYIENMKAEIRKR